MHEVVTRVQRPGDPRAARHGSSTGTGMHPATCTSGVSGPDEQIIEFVLFDVTACVQPDLL